MNAISIIGHKDAGKTRLIEALIPVLQDRGYRVGTVKHAPHVAVHGDPNADSAQHRRAGATRTLLIGEDGAALFFDPEDDLTRLITAAFPDCDLVLVEGFKHGPFPKIEVYRPRRDVRTEPLAGEIDVVGVVTDAHVVLPDGVVTISPRRVEEIADLIEDQFR